MSNTGYKISKGNPVLLGATIIGEAINMAIVAPGCTTCKLIFSNHKDRQKKVVIAIESQYCVGDVWCVQINGFPYKEYDYYYEIDGKRVLDPYARRIIGREKWGKPLVGGENTLYSSFAFEDFNWEGDVPLEIPFHKMILYKMHVRGFTKHSSSGCKKNAGTFKGVIDKIPYLKELGINAVMLMPISEFNEIMVDSCYENCYELGQRQGIPTEYINIGKENTLDYMKSSPSFESCAVPVQMQSRIPYRINYWGYGRNTFYFAPKASYASEPDNAGNELKELIKELHKASIEVLLEFSFESSISKRMILDCLYYWYFEFHVDGFSVNGDHLLTGLIANDPILSKTKLLATAWDNSAINKVYYNLAEYNDGFMVDARKYLKGDEEQVGQFSYRLRKNPEACPVINYITNHNGFTLMDLVSYDLKHNENNGENNKDGTDYNYSWNCGVEGRTSKKKIKQLRLQQIKNALVMVFLSQGTPMIVMGDEFGNSQAGNNNAYCQDNSVSWLNWKHRDDGTEIEEFVKRLIKIRATYGVFSRKDEYKMMDYLSFGCPDLSFHGTKAWYPDYSLYSRVFGAMYCGEYVEDSSMKKDYFYIAFNMHWEKHRFDLPSLPSNMTWSIFLYTTQEFAAGSQEDKRVVEVPPRSILVLKSVEK